MENVLTPHHPLERRGTRTQVWVGRVLTGLLAAFLLLDALGKLLLLAPVTAYLGGATATHVLHGTPFWLPPVMGVLLWIAYGLRSPALRALVTSQAR